MLHHPYQPRSQDVDHHVLYHHTLSGHIPREWPRPIELGLFVVASVVPSLEDCMDILGHSVGEAKKVLVLGLAPQQYALQTKGYKSG